VRAASGTRLRRVLAWAVVAAAAPIITATAMAGDASVPPASGPPLHEDLVPAGRSLEERLAEIQRRIQTAALYPPIARARNESGEARIAFEIDPEGRPVKIHVARSSGSTTLDRAAARAVEGAAPLPHLLGEINVPVRFELSDPE